MNRKQIKKIAKNKAKNNLWNIWKPGLIIILITYIIICGFYLMYDYNILSSIITSLVSILFLPLSIGYVTYLIKLINEDNNDINLIWKPYNNFFNILLGFIIIPIMITIGLALAVIPGVIISLGISQVPYILAENKISIWKAIKLSFRMTKGYKWQIFKFYLSFIGWQFLGALTLGILYIWLYPYMMTSRIVLYEKLKSNLLNKPPKY